MIEWSAWDRFLITYVLPSARRIPFRLGTPLCALDVTPGEGAIVLLHVNLTMAALAYPDLDAFVLSCRQRGARILNHGAVGIDKRALQETCLAQGLPSVRAGRDGPADELLVVKRRANHGGKSEALVPPRYLGGIEALFWPYPRRIHVARRGDLDPAHWRDDGLTVERFVTNGAGLFQRAYVAGAYVAVATARADGPLKEMNHAAGVKLAATRDARRLADSNKDARSVAFRLARAMGLDYGALDLAVAEDGTVFPIDVNPTPYWADDRNPRLIRELRGAFAAIAGGAPLPAQDGALPDSGR